MARFLYIAVALIAVCHADATSVGVPAVPITTAALVPTQDTECKERNSYYQVASSCDAYLKCTDYKASQMYCPDGLHFNPDVKWPEDPCGYPMDVPCMARSAVQPAQATADCPHQYGYFPSPAANHKDCRPYRLCIAGSAIEMMCPLGLAFNPDTSRCDWPDQVPNCKAAEYLGFTCPAANDDKIYNYKFEGNCYYFVSCQQGRARLLSCDPGLAFDPVSSRCVLDNLVSCALKAVKH